MTTTILSKAAVIKNNSDYTKLINAVISNLGGTEYVQDINSHGIDGGYGNFVYYSDTHAFAIKYRKQIVMLLEMDADDLGEDIVSMVAGFGVFRRSPMDQQDKKDLYRYLGGSKVDQGAITNVMAWYAAETVCRWFED